MTKAKEGDCCLYVHLKEHKHPLYRCQNCGKWVKLVEVKRVVAMVVDGPEIKREAK